MCGIAGFIGPKAEDNVKAALSVMKRGDDGSVVLKRKTFAIGQRRLRIVGDVVQPIKEKGILSANCEIYNWQELCRRHNIPAKNDAELLIRMLDKFGVKKTIDELDGVYAFCYYCDGKISLARDILGVKPLWFCKNAFASERKGLLAMGERGEELNPRKIAIIDVEKLDVTFVKRPFFKTVPEIEEPFEPVKAALEAAVYKRIPDVKMGVLFSGGIDSVVIAQLLKKKGEDFVCYVTGGGRDEIAAKKIANELGLTLKVVGFSPEDVEKNIGRIAERIEIGEVTKSEVALTLDFALRAAASDGVKVMFSGAGSEDVFGGYQRQLKAASLNRELRSGLLKLHEKDLYTLDLISMAAGIELRLPFLDRTLVDLSLKVNEKFKVSNNRRKIILRDIAKKIGINEETAERKKVAAQYGSKVSGYFQKLAKRNGMSRSKYLRQFDTLMPRIGVLSSSGKDSWYAAWILSEQGFELSCVISLISENKESYMFHTPNAELVKLQAKLSGLPLISQRTLGVKEDELVDLEVALEKAKKTYSIDGISVGAIASVYQRDRVQKICEKLGLKMYAPLWHTNQESEMRDLIRRGFEIVLSSVNAYGLDRTWLGRILTQEDVDKLCELNEKYGINVAGEGGEYESLVLACPLFEGRLEVTKSEIHEDGGSATWIALDAKAIKTESLNT